MKMKSSIMFTYLNDGIIKTYTIPREKLSTENFDKEVQEIAAKQWPKEARMCNIVEGRTLRLKNE